MASIKPSTLSPFYEEYYRLIKFSEPVQMSESGFFDILVKMTAPYYPVSLVTSGFGTVSNLINMAVFYRQGLLTDSCTVTLAASSFVGFSICVNALLQGMSMVIAVLADPNDPEVSFDDVYGTPVSPETMSCLRVPLIVFTYPPFAFTEITGWLTAYLAFERMFSVAFPFKVRTIFTPKRSCKVISVLSLAIFLIQVPRYMGEKLAWLEIDGTNGTRRLEIVNTGLTPHSLHNSIEFFNQTIASLFHVVVIIVCNAIIAVKVNSSQRFRKSTTTSINSTTTITAAAATKTTKTTITSSSSSSSSSTASYAAMCDVSSNTTNEIDRSRSRAPAINNSEDKARREARLIRVMVLLSITFLVSRVPRVINLLFMKILDIITDEIWYGTAIEINYLFVVTLMFIEQFLIRLSEATNIFIYLTMSKNYRKTFRQILICKTQKKNFK